MNTDRPAPVPAPAPDERAGLFAALEWQREQLVTQWRALVIAYVLVAVLAVALAFACRELAELRANVPRMQPVPADAPPTRGPGGVLGP